MGLKYVIGLSRNNETLLRQLGDLAKAACTAPCDRHLLGCPEESVVWSERDNANGPKSFSV